MRAQMEAGQAGSFRYVEINALRLASPQHAYVHLYRVSIILSSNMILKVMVHNAHFSSLQVDQVHLHLRLQIQAGRWIRATLPECSPALRHHPIHSVCIS